MSSQIHGNFKIQQIFLLALIYFSLSVYAKKMEAQYESGDHYKLFRISQPLILQCKPKVQSDGKNIFWKRNDTIVTEIKELKGHYYTVPNEGKFIIEKSKEEDAGSYSCHMKDEEEMYPFEAIAQVIVKVNTESQVTEGDDIEVLCIVKGTNPTITWYLKKETDGEESDYEKIVDKSEERIKIEEKEDNSQVLTIDTTRYSDRGHYRCNASNDLMNNRGVPDASDEEFVRVKDKMAPVWPAIGIVVQLVVLILVIVISEKRRNQNEVDESDTDEGPEKPEDANFIRNRN